MPNEDLWHQRMRHASYKQLSIVFKKEAVLGIPKLVKVNNVVCGSYQLGKQIRAHHHANLTTTTSRPLELLHIDLLGRTRIESLGDKRYIMVVVNDFTRFTWAILLRFKFEAPHQIETLCKRLQNEKGETVNHLLSDQGREFENSQLQQSTLKLA